VAGSRQLLLGFGVLVGIQILTSTVAIALLNRMSPAIEQILEENVASVEAVEGMLAVIAESPSPSAEERRRFRVLLEAASANVTEPGEQDALEELRAAADGALAGDAESRRRAATALRELGAINRAAMQRADDDAKRLGTAGAWAAALLGLFGLGASLLVLARTRQRLLAPVSELVDVVEAHEAGHTHRRCTIERSGSRDLARVMEHVNRLLDRRGRTGAPPEGDPIDRLALLALLDERSEPWVLVGPEGELLAANREAEAALAGDRGRALREAIARVPTEEETPLVAERQPVADTGATMCALSPVE